MPPAFPCLLHATILPKTDSVEGGEVEIGCVAALSVDEFGAKRTVDLIPHGAHKKVTNANKAQYVSAVAVFKLGGCVKAQLAALGEVLARHPQVFVLADEIYEHIIFEDQPFTSFATACPDLRDRTLMVNGVSKAFAMTGWRIGYGAGPRELINAMTTVQSQVTSGACAIAQAAAAAALDGPQDDVRRFREAFERRRNLVVAGAEKIPGLTLAPPGGAFYTFIGCEEFIGATAPDGTVIEDDIGFAKYLLNEGKVAAVPGSAYGLSPFIRFSTATSDEKLSQAMTRMADCLSKLTTSPSRN